jgi:SAM-dependent methyltransferase
VKTETTRDASTSQSLDLGSGAVDLLSSTTLLRRLEQLQAIDSLETLRSVIADVNRALRSASNEPLPGVEEGESSGAQAQVCRALDQIGASQTVGRAHHYLKQLIRSLTELKTSPLNDINLLRWKEYQHILTDSLWLIDRRDNSGVHTAGYWGNFVPQIPRQMMLRYTKRGEWVLDPFAGAGTTLIEGQRLGRNTLGIELQPDVAHQARQLIDAEANPHSVTSVMITGDSLTLDYTALLKRHGQRAVQLIILHPPYFDIIKFSNDPRDLSNYSTVHAFLDALGTVVDQTRTVLDPGRYLALVIGDKYARGEWIPLGFLTMNEVVRRGFLLKSIVVKNFEETSGKRRQKELWRYRALSAGFYVFKHEYIFILQKR